MLFNCIFSFIQRGYNVSPEISKQANKQKKKESEFKILIMILIACLDPWEWAGEKGIHPRG